MAGSGMLNDCKRTVAFVKNEKAWLTYVADTINPINGIFLLLSTASKKRFSLNFIIVNFKFINQKTINFFYNLFFVHHFI